MNIDVVIGSDNSVHFLKDGSEYQYEETPPASDDESIIFLPSVERRNFESMQAFFKIVAHSRAGNNKWIKFTALTFDPSTYSLFMAVTVLDESMAKSAEWGNGKYCIFRSSLAALGIMEDAETFAQTRGEVKSLLAFNQKVYAWIGNHFHVFDVEKGKKSKSKVRQKAGRVRLSNLYFQIAQKAFLHMEEGTPLAGNLDFSFKGKAETEESIPVVGSLVLPYYSKEIKVVESGLLEGATFIGIVALLTCLLLVIVAVDTFIIYS